MFRSAGDSTHVPIAPAQCCRACLGAQVHELSSCRALSHCNRRGVCVMGACQCNRGWGGAACEQRMRHTSWPPLWFTYLMMLVTVLISSIAWIASRHILQDFVERRRQVQEEQQALLVRKHTVALGRV